MTLKTSFTVGIAVAALVVGVQTASAAPTPDASDRTSLVQPDFGQNFLYPGGYPQSGHGYLGNQPASASAVGSGSEIEYPGGYPQSGHGYLGNQPASASAVGSGREIEYPGGYPQSGHGYLGNQPASASAVGSGSEIDWPQLGVGFGVGIAVLLGLILTVRIGRSHPVAH